MDRDETKRVLAVAAVLWPRARLWPDGHAPLAVDVWHRILGDLDQRTVIAALEVAALDGLDFPPQPGELRRRAVTLALDAAGQGIPALADAWREVGEQIRSAGIYGKPVWSHPAVAEAVQAYGWGRLCMSTNSDVAFAAFRRLYETTAGRAERAHVIPDRLRDVIGAAGARFALTEGDTDAR